MRKLLFTSFIITLCLNGHTQETKQNAIRLKKLNEYYSIASFRGRNTLWSNDKNQALIPFDKSIYHFFPQRNILFRIFENDSIQSINLNKSSFETIVTEKQKSTLYLTEDKKLVYVEHGNIAILDSRSVDSIGNGNSILGFIGIEIIDEDAIIMNYEKRPDLAAEPLRYPNGEYVTKFDSVNNELVYLWPVREKGYSLSGVQNLKNQKWIIEPSCDWIVKGADGYVAKHSVYEQDSLEEFDKQYYTIYDSKGKVIKDLIEENEILNNPEFNIHLVPKYKADSIFVSWPKDTDEEFNFFLPAGIYFKTKNGKIGRFTMSTNIIEDDPADFILFTPFEYFNVKIDNKSTKINFYDTSITISLDRSSQFELYKCGIRMGFLQKVLRVKNSKVDNVYLPYTRYSNSISDSLVVETFNESFLSLFLDSAAIPEEIEDKYWFDERSKFGLSYLKGQLIIENFETDGWDSEAQTKCYSGVFDLKKHRWVVEPKNYKIYFTNKSYKVYESVEDYSNGIFKTYDLKGRVL